jgi:RNA polymerase sigma-70 factor (ECF subfamily)
MADPERGDRADIERLRGAAGDGRALADLFARYRSRLKRMVKLRMDPRVQGRVDPSDVVQEAYIEAERQLRDYLNDPQLPVFLWLRLVAGQRLTVAHRRHLGVQARDAGREVSIYRGPIPEASSAALAAQLLGRLTTPSQAAARAELKLRVQEALNDLDPIDREVLVLRHFEQLGNAETAAVLGIGPTAACNRYVRALERLRTVLGDFPGEV